MILDRSVNYFEGDPFSLRSVNYIEVDPFLVRSANLLEVDMFLVRSVSYFEVGPLWPKKRKLFRGRPCIHKRIVAIGHAFFAKFNDQFAFWQNYQREV